MDLNTLELRFSGSASGAVTSIVFYSVFIKCSESPAQFHTGRNNILLNADVLLAEQIIWTEIGCLSWDLLTKVSQTIKQIPEILITRRGGNANAYDDYKVQGHDAHPINQNKQ